MRHGGGSMFRLSSRYAGVVSEANGFVGTQVGRWAFSRVVGAPDGLRNRLVHGQSE